MATNGTSGLELLSRNQYDCFCGPRAPRRKRHRAAAAHHRIQPHLPVIMITAYGTVGNVVDAIRAGAENFTQKPWDNEKLLADIRVAISRIAPKKRSCSSSAPSSSATTLSRSSAKASPCSASSTSSARSPPAVPPSSSGRERHGKGAYRQGTPRQLPAPDRPFVPVNTGACHRSCSSPPSSVTSKEPSPPPSAPRRASSRSPMVAPLLDEIGTMGMDMQAKILPSCRTVVLHLGGTQEIQVDVRIIAALTSPPAGRPRRAFPRRPFLPPQRHLLELPHSARREYIPLLAAHFLKFYAEENSMEPRYPRPRRHAQSSWTTSGPATSASLRTQWRGCRALHLENDSRRSAPRQPHRQHLLGQHPRPTAPTPASST